MDKLPYEYDGLQSDLECKVGEPDPLIPDGEVKPYLKEKITVPEEANGKPKGSWKILLCILACAAPLIAAAVLLFLKLIVPAAICAGVFVLGVTVFIVALVTAEKRLLSGVSVLNKPDTRRIIATVTESVCVKQTYRPYRKGWHGPHGYDLVGAVYVITVKENGEESQKTYVAKTTRYYAKNEEVAAYVRGKYAYIDETDRFNEKKTAMRKNI